MSGRGGGRGAYYRSKYGGGGRGGPRPPADQSGGTPRYTGHIRKAEDDAPGWSPGPRRGSPAQLASELERIDGKGYGAYHDIAGGWDFPGFTLWVDRVQGDPYASPSRCRVVVPAGTAGLPSHLLRPRPRRLACADFLARRFGEAVAAAGGDVRAAAVGWAGAKGGEMGVDVPGQYVLERTAVQVGHEGHVEARFTVALPAAGRSVLGRWARSVLTEALPRYVNAALRHASLDAAALAAHADAAEDAAAARAALPALGLVAFVADGAVLPRADGASQAPMPAAWAVLSRAPESQAVVLTLPHAGRVRGLGIRRGVTLIVGGGFHGKSTLLQALEGGVYDRIPGDGRELVVTDPRAVKIRAEDGRRVCGVDISPFIGHLPRGRGTRAFLSADASGSTSQAANIQEAVEAGATALLIDEDTSATNFMIRDARMRALVSRGKEPITPFVEHVRRLAACGVSTVMVIGGSGDYFGVADTVLCMEEYEVRDVTEQAKRIATEFAAAEGGAGREEGRPPREWSAPPPRRLAGLAAAASGAPRLKLKTRAKGSLTLDDEEVDLSAVEQLVEISQTRAVGESLRWAARMLPQGPALTLPQMLDRLDAEMDQEGLDAITHSGEPAGDLARPRRFEIAAAINRWRSAHLEQCTGS
uniref:Isopentenyl-diphosphate delta-isomerase n=1 Tax=Auxenochlorella protothecoides TaxID=3075 RepID=A0A1D2A4R6_AUXPR